MNEYIPLDWDERGSIIKVIGVGGGGNNAVSHMANLGIKDVDFVLCNTDAQVLQRSPITNRVNLGATLTKGRGAGCDPERGKQAAEESIDAISEMLNGVEMAFITAGMGGGTGTGAAPVIARVAKERGILTVGIVTFPFKDEGLAFTRRAVEGIKEMQKHVDSLLIINNDKLYEMYGDLPVRAAFKKADDILAIAVKGIAEIITNPGYINVDFEDVKKVMKDSGVALMGTGVGQGDNRALQAVENALNSPLLNNNSISGARSILVNISSSEGDSEITMTELGNIMNYIQREAGMVENMKRGVVYNPALGDSVSVTIVATGFNMKDIPELGVEILEDNSTARSGKVRDGVELVHLEDEPKEKTVVQQRELGFDEDELLVSEKSELGGSAKPVIPTPTAATSTTSTEYKGKPIRRGLTGLKSDDVKYIEEVPAFQRKNIVIEKKQHSSTDGISENTIEENEDGTHTLKPNNSFLNPKVD